MLSQDTSLIMPVTEMGNDVTECIDVASPLGIVEMLSVCNSQMLNGWQHFKSLASSEVQDDIMKVSMVVCNILEHEQGSIILSGCGTSGRIAFTLVRKFNELLEELGYNPCFDYLIAGGDKALFSSQEASEDDPASGRRALQQAMKGKECAVLIGITCGFSASYIAGQLDYCFNNLDVLTPVLLGFNPVVYSKNVEIENWDKTFRQVAESLQKLQETGKGFIINPILGPEAITGSSRMKGGSATKIILESVFLTAIQKILNKPQLNYLHAMRLTVCQTTCKPKHQIASLVQMAGDSLNAEGHIYYIGAGITGILGLVDASECPPTFSSKFDDVRGFLLGGYQSFRNKEGNLSNKGEAYCISLEHFTCKIQPSLSADDTVIFILHSDSRILKTFHKIYEKLQCICKVSAIFVDVPFEGMIYKDFVRQHFKDAVTVNLPWDQILSSFNCNDAINGTEDKLLNAAIYGAIELSIKLILNAISTGAHVLKGKVYKHFMVDMKLSNSKLLNRGVNIVQKLSGCSRDHATEAILKSIYQTDHLSTDIHQAKISEHIQKANSGTKLVPLALILANKKCTVQEATTALKLSKQIRTAIDKVYAAE